MIDIDPQIADSFSRLYPVPAVAADWDDVLDRARTRRKDGIGLPMRRTHGRGLLAASVLVFAVGAALYASTLLSSSPSVLERAQAALDPNGRILHIVSRWAAGGTTLEESWSLPDGSRTHVVYRSASGAFGADCVIRETETRCWNPELDVIDVYRHAPPEPGLPPRQDVRYGADWPEGLRRGLGSGYARPIGNATFCGRAVFAVLLAVPGRPGRPEFQAGVSHTLYLDRETYLPVAERMPEAGFTRYFDTFEFLAGDSASRRAVELPAPVGARVVVHPVGEYPPERKETSHDPIGPECTPAK